MTTIRPATAADTDRLVAMSLRFQATTKYAQHLRATPETVAALIATLLASADATILVVEQAGELVGMLAAAIYVQPMSLERIGSEIVWWMEPEARGGRAALRLLRTAEAWAQERGATVFQMMAPSPEVSAFYERLGYAEIETHHQRRLVLTVHTSGGRDDSV